MREKKPCKPRLSRGRRKDSGPEASSGCAALLWTTVARLERRCSEWRAGTDMGRQFGRNQATKEIANDRINNTAGKLKGERGQKNSESHARRDKEEERQTEQKDS